MKKKLLIVFLISSFLLNSILVIADTRVIYKFEQITDSSGRIELNWNKEGQKENIQVTGYYLIEGDILEVSYRVGEDIPKGFNKMTIILNKSKFPLKIVLKQQQVDKARISDLPQNKIDKYNILNLYDRGIINGYTDGTVKPNDLVTRAEFSAMMVAAATYDIDINSPSIFTDVPNNFWGKKYIMTLARKNILNGVGNGLFDPNGKVTIGQVIAIIDRTFDFYNNENSYHEPSIRDYSYDNYISLAKAGIIREGDDFYYPYTPNIKATRMQCATLLSRVLETLYEVN